MTIDIEGIRKLAGAVTWRNTEREHVMSRHCLALCDEVERLEVRLQERIDGALASNEHCRACEAEHAAELNALRPPPPAPALAWPYCSVRCSGPTCPRHATCEEVEADVAGLRKLAVGQE